MNRAILLSGGQDSMALAYLLRPEIAITIDYGQAPAPSEISASRAFCVQMEIPHEIVRVDCGGIGVGELVGSPGLSFSPTPEWWPFRNQLLVTVAAMRLVGRGIEDLLIGTVKGDMLHADGRESFIAAMSHLLSIQEGKLRLSAPGMHLSTPELVVDSGIPVELLALAFSCHRGADACGKCRGCIKNFEVLSMMQDRMAE